LRNRSSTISREFAFGKQPIRFSLRKIHKTFPAKSISVCTRSGVYKNVETGHRILLRRSTTLAYPPAGWPSFSATAANLLFMIFESSVNLSTTQ
jgi:hypothetical protein